MPSSSDAAVLVVGAGSAGARHARLLASLGGSVAVTDPVGERAEGVEGVEVIPFASDLGDLGRFAGVVVASPTAFHHEHATRAVEAGCAVLVEKPLATSAEGLDALVAAAGSSLTVGYNLRLHRPVERFRELLLDGVVGPIAHARLWFGSRLSGWRPGVDYRSTYSARADLGGGILLDASHEVDLLLWLLGGEWEVEGAVMGQRSSLDLEPGVDDVAVALLRRSDGVPAIVTVDSVSQGYRRGIEVVGDRATVRLDWATGRIDVELGGRTTVEDADAAVDDSYRRQARAFLDLVRGEGGPVVTAAEGAAVVSLCDDVRRAARWDTQR